MANTNININITASDTATPTIQKVEQAVANLGKKATTSISITGLDAIDKQLSALTSKATGGNLKMNAGLTPSATADLKNWGATAVLASANATNGFKNYENQLKNVSSNIDNIGSRLRYLSLVSGVIFAGLSTVTLGFIKSARDMEESQLKLMVATQTTGVSFESANEMAKKLSADGMMSMKTAYSALTNAIVGTTGMAQKGVETAGKPISEIALAQAGALVQMWKDSAVVMKQNMADTTDVAIEKASSGFRTLREIMADSTGIEIKFTEAYKVYAKELNNGNTSLNRAQQQQAIYNAYMKEGQRYTGAAALASATFSGSLTKMNANVLMMKQNIGNALVPVFGVLAAGIDKASRSIGEFANKHSAWTMTIIVGTVAMAGLITAVAMLGALGNMFYSSIGGIINIFKGITIGGLQTTAVIIGLTVAIGALVYAWLKMSGKWDQWKNSMSTLGQKIKDTMKQVSNAGSTASETTSKLAKALRDLQSSITDTSKDFNQQMSEWVVNHDKTIKKLKDQIGDLADEYKKSTDKIKKDFEETNKDLTLSHARKSEDLQEQIDEEVSKGIWADQTKIKNLKKELARENEDYLLSSKDKLDTKDEELTEEQKQYKEKLTDLEDELKKEKDLEEKHSKLISYYRTQPYLDEIEKMEEAYKKRLSSLTIQLSDIKEQYATEISGINSATDALDLLGAKADETNTKLNNISWGTSIGRAIGEFADSFTRNWNLLVEGISNFKFVNFFNNFLTGWNSLMEDLKNNFRDAMLEIGGGDYFKGFMSSLELLGLAIAAIGVALKIGLPASAAVGFAGATTGIAATGFLGMLSKMALPILITIVTAEALKKIWELGNELRGLKVEMDAADKSGRDATALQSQAFINLTKKVQEGKISVDQYNTSLTRIGTNNWSNQLFNNVNSFFSAIATTSSNMSSMYSSNNSSVTSSPFNKRASGGNVISGSPYLVGEKGPELFFPNTNGYVASNDKLGGTNITNNISIVNPSVRSNADIQSIAQAVKDVISREMSLKQYT